MKGIVRIFFCAGVIVVLVSCRRAPPTNESPAAPSELQVQTNSSPGRFEELVGRWLRPDGGYILEVASIDGEGRAQAAYYNPRQINVANARAVRDGAKMKLFVELRDTGYPGSTYTLVYNPETKRLEGDYFQATMNETYQIFFVREEQ